MKKISQIVQKRKIAVLLMLCLLVTLITPASSGQLEKVTAAQTENDTASVAGTSLQGITASPVYNMEGFADASNVTGGGVQDETSENYYTAGTAKEFLSALTAVKKSGNASVIEITNDLGLGSLEIETSLLSTYSGVIQETKNQPLLHPTLLETGVSTLKLSSFSNLTIYSKNGSSIKHACITLSGSSNIIIRNIVFDELWEWDEGGYTYSGEYCEAGDYDRNDWDYLTIESKSTGIWVDHCTFYKAYDGIIDIKKADSSTATNVTISWSQFLPGSQGSFFSEMMELLEANPENYAHYNKLMTTYEMTKSQIRGYASAQKKTHLVGASDSESNISNLTLTLANNYYKNSMDRMPRLRGGVAHIYNCIMDSEDLYTLRNSLTNSNAKNKVVSNGSISTVGASVLVENSSIRGIINALLSGNGSSKAGYIGAQNTEYMLDGISQELTVTDKAGEGLVLNISSFLNNLPYSEYQLQDATSLDENVLPYTGAGTLSFSGTEWMQTSYEAVIEIPATTETVTTTEVPVTSEVVPTVNVTPSESTTPVISETPVTSVVPTTPSASIKPSTSSTATVAPATSNTPSVSPSPSASTTKVSIKVDGKISDWKKVSTHLTGTGRVKKIKVYNTSSYLYVAAQGNSFSKLKTTELLFDTDNNKKTGYRGYTSIGGAGFDYMICNGTVYKYTGAGKNWKWKKAASISASYKKSKTCMEWKVSLSKLGIKTGKKIKVAFVGKNAKKKIISIVKRTSNLKTYTVKKSYR